MTKRLQVVLNDDTEARLRDAIYKTKGMKKGNISEAIEEAIEDWIAKNTRTKSKESK
jgi:hypothetical protein